MSQHPRLLLVTLFAAISVPVRAAASDTAGAGTETHTVTAAPLGEERPVGANDQPDWTTQHRFSEVEVYLLAPWEFSAEQGWDATAIRHGETVHALRQEFELGLPYHCQIDYVAHEESDEDGFHFSGNGIEASAAFAKWGVIPLNPTLLVEWTFGYHESNEIEGKLLLGADLAPHWHWGANVGVEQDLGGEDERTIATSQAVSYSILGDKLGVGAELKLAAVRGEDEDDDGKPSASPSAGKDEDDDHYAIELTAGPSIQWRITDDIHLDAASLFGLTGPSPFVDTFVTIAFTWELGGNGEAESDENKRLEPVSTRHY